MGKWRLLSVDFAGVQSNLYATAMGTFQTTLVTAVAFVCSAAGGAPPKVVSTDPEHLDSAVDASTGEITIRFDQDMNPAGRSICGGGPEFPAPVGAPHWLDAKTLAFAVKLEPDHEYALSINCPSARNFKSVAGEAAEVTPLRFRTRAAGAPAVILTPQQNHAACGELRRVMKDVYSYRDRLRIDWNRVFDEAEPDLVACQRPVQFAKRIAPVLAQAQDLHMTLRVSPFTFPTATRTMPRNADMRVLTRCIDGFARKGDDVSLGKFERDGIGYIGISSWSATDKPAPEIAALDALKDCKGLIVDVRFNSGGDEIRARDFAARFVSTPATYSKNQYRDPASADGWGRVLERRIEPAGPRFEGPVVVLMGRANMSSCESFLLMMKCADATLMGERSWGSSGNPHAFELGNGVTLVVPTWRDLTPEGAEIEGVGIAPDIELKYIPDPAGSADNLVDAARARLAKHAP